MNVTKTAGITNSLLYPTECKAYGIQAETFFDSLEQTDFTPIMLTSKEIRQTRLRRDEMQNVQCSTFSSFCIPNCGTTCYSVTLRYLRVYAAKALDTQ